MTLLVSCPLLSKRGLKILEEKLLGKKQCRRYKYRNLYKRFDSARQIAHRCQNVALEYAVAREQILHSSSVMLVVVRNCGLLFLHEST